ncbi:MAG: hypothetical protein QOJ89_3389 [bacterium]|jgi:hypothetical protein
MQARLPRAGAAIVAVAGLAVAMATGAAAGTIERTVQRTPAVPAAHVAGADAPATPASPPRPRTAPPPRAIALAGARRLAAPACELQRDVRAGRVPDVVAARGSQRARALVTESVAAALLGLPVEVPDASAPARERLDAAHARLSRALADGDDASAAAAAASDRSDAYAAALGIAGCG